MKQPDFHPRPQRDERPEAQNPRLLRAMEAISYSDTRTNRKALYTELVRATLLVVIPSRPDGCGGGQVEHTTKLRICTFQNLKGDTVVPVFTDEDSLRQWKPEGASYTALTGQDLFRVVSQSAAAEIIVNPAGPIGGRLPRHEFEALASGHTPEYMIEPAGAMKLNAGTKLYIGAPANAPSEPLLNCIRQALKKVVGVAAAYAFNMSVGNNPPNLSIGIYFDTKPSAHVCEELFSQIGRQMKPFISDKNYVDLLPLDPANVLGVTVREKIQPFYKRLIQ